CRETALLSRKKKPSPERESFEPRTRGIIRIETARSGPSVPLPLSAGGSLFEHGGVSEAIGSRTLGTRPPILDQFKKGQLLLFALLVLLLLVALVDFAHGPPPSMGEIDEAHG